ncbi:ATP-binding protein [Falsiroseomonas selenitidurans]|uniref:ATP-binding protein n=1 Tax=Falsiroseomonas selenitidurans TaxID=2716335 RepID=UPI001438CA96|nr:ATP-binding protein [Falsiroseomonas selenitidurans]
MADLTRWLSAPVVPLPTGADRAIAAVLPEAALAMPEQLVPQQSASLPLGELVALADLGIGAACLAGCLALVRLCLRRPGLRQRPLPWLLGIFLLLCGAANLMDAFGAGPGARAAMRLATAAAGLAAALALWRLLPHLLRLPSVSRLRSADQARAEARRRASFEHSPVPLFTLAPDQTVADISNSWLSLLGYAHAEVVGRPLQDFLPPDQPLEWTAAERAALAAGEPCEREQRFRHADGRTLDALVTVRREQGAVAPNLTCVLVDITARKRAEAALRTSEARLRHAQKMEAIGGLAAGVAHDFNNILQSVVGALEMVLEELPPGTAGHDYAAVALGAAERGSSLTHHLLSYARKQLLQPRHIPLEPFLADLRKLLMRTLGPHIEVSVQAGEVPGLLADPGQLQTALLNLAINAAHAMRQGGTLRITARLHAPQAARWVCLSVADSGAGMDAATLARAVEPFFTTKGRDGSGLGLSMVQGFAEQSGGRLQIQSVVGQGTRVDLWLPAAEAAPVERPAAAPAPAASGRVLLVDDSPDVLLITGTLLERAGFSVARAASGDRALELLSQSPFDALVTDYAMAGLNGADLITEARLMRPRLRTLLITGFADQRYADRLPPGTLVLHKPYQRQDLLAAMNRILQPQQGSVI